MAENKHGRRKTLMGKVASDKMDKTIVIEVPRRLIHPMYKKFVSSRRRFMAHDEENTCRVGDTVEIKEYRPLSRHKPWMVTRVIARAVVT